MFVPAHKTSKISVYCHKLQLLAARQLTRVLRKGWVSVLLPRRLIITANLAWDKAKDMYLSFKERFYPEELYREISHCYSVYFSLHFISHRVAGGTNYNLRYLFLLLFF